MILPSPPSAADFSRDANKWAQDLENWARSLNGILESTINALGDPAKAAILITNSVAPTTTLDVAGATLGDVKEFIAGLVATMKAKGLLRSKVGAT